MKNLAETQAFALMRRGHAVRRDAWRKWATWRQFQVVIHTPADGATPAEEHPAYSTDYDMDAWRGQDWTDEPWLTASGIPGPLAPGARPPTGPGDAVPGGSSGSAGGGSSGGSSAGGSSGSAGNPPGPGGEGPGLNLSGSGGEKKDEEDEMDDEDKLTHNPPGGLTPTVTVSVFAPLPEDYEADPDVDYNVAGACFNGGAASPYQLSALRARLTVSGGPPGLGFGKISMSGGPQATTTMKCGESAELEITGTINYHPGSTLTVLGEFRLAHRSYTGSGTVTIPNYCPVAVNYLVAGFALPECFEHLAAEMYLKGADFDPGSINGSFSSFMLPGDGTTGFSMGFDIGDSKPLYTACGEATSSSSISGWAVSWSVVRAGSTYTVTGTYSGADLVVFSGTGAAGAPIANSVGPGTITITA